MNDTDDAQDRADLPDENPNRPREYHGVRTVIAGAGVVLAVAAALWLTLLQPGPDGGDDTGGVVDLPAELVVDGRAVGERIDNLAPDFELRTLDGESLRLSDMRGRPVLINFWASWCGPCRREVPALIRAQERWGDHGLIVVGVNIEESDGQALDFADEFGINYAVPMDYRGEVFRAYGGGGINGPPRSFFVAPDGVIVRIYAGQAPDELIAEHAREFIEAYAPSE
ncbi:MAG: TlpA family protein disulfide reductase [Chloroflexi bacterium]|nr:TlpA family protein disulfide reductase [Chloroflexota bacterium]MYD15751.1 TlpA family protein disulfide reductase [Chloroflexota bacterium]MYJ01504.1 TlpA family protein disulfide reductase [Chloroflexota bacterium]